MNTTALFAEQLVIGVLALLAFGILVDPTLLASLSGTMWGGIALVVPLAYVVGIVYDRVADSILQSFEAHHRLWIVYKGKKVINEQGDVFPENEIRMRLFESAGASSYADYLRSRLRLVRALATLLPAMTVAGFLINHPELAATDWCLSLRGATMGIYVALIGSKMLGLECHRPPRTNGASEAHSSHFKRLFSPSLPKQGPIPHRLSAWRFAFKIDAVVAAAFVLQIGLFAGLLLAHGHAEQLGWALAGTLATLIATWSWWRIAGTYCSFLLDWRNNTK